MGDGLNRGFSDRMEDHSVMWKYIASGVAAASTTAMLLLVVYFVYSDSRSTSPTASLDMYDKYRQYSSQYADQLYDRVGNVTDVVTSYKRSTEFRLDQHEKMIEALQKQISEQKATYIMNNNTNTQGSGREQ